MTGPDRKRPDLSQLGQRLLAIGLLIALLASTAAVLVAPLLDALGERNRAIARLNRFEAALAVPLAETRQYDPQELAALRRDDGEAQIALQSILDRLVREAGVIPQTIRPLPPEDLGAAGRSVWVELTLAGDLQSLVDLLNAMDAVRPTLLVQRLDINAGGYTSTARNVQIQIEAGQVWRATEETP